MRYYGCHAEIPTDVRRFILRETGERRVKRVSIELCNELADEFFEFEEENERLKDFALHFQRRGEKSPTVQKYQSYKDAAVALDRVIDYNISCKDVTAVITQAGRPLRGFENGRVIFSRSIYG
jgi:hypothetical protein